MVLLNGEMFSNQQLKKMNNGFLVVASKNKRFLTAAQLLADSIKEYTQYPITLVTDNEWILDPGNHIFDNVIGGAPKTIRAKLWALTKTPYDITCFLDADVVCLSDNANNVFEALCDNDIVFTKIRPYCASACWWNIHEEERPHGGAFVWKNNEKMKTFMEEWWNNWQWKMKHHWHPRWDFKYEKDPVEMWDQFPLHLMLCDKEDVWYRDDIKWNWYFNTTKNDDCLWNFTAPGYDCEIENVNYSDIVFLSYPKGVGWHD